MELILFVKTSMANFIITKKTALELKTYKKVYIPSDKILKSSRTYTKSESRTVIKVPAILVPFLQFSHKLQQSLKKTKFHATEMPWKILAHFFGCPKMF